MNSVDNCATIYLHRFNVSFSTFLANVIDSPTADAIDNAVTDAHSATEQREYKNNVLSKEIHSKLKATHTSNTIV